MTERPTQPAPTNAHDVSAAAAPSLASPAFEALLGASEQALVRGDHSAGAEQAQLAFERGEQSGASDSQLARALNLLATHQWRLGQFEDAALSGRRALVRWQRLDNPAAACETHCLLATAFTELGLHEEALRHAASAFDLARRHDLPAQEALALNRLGVCHERLGDPEHGEQYLLGALAQATAQGDVAAEAMALNNLAAVAIGGFHLLRQRGENAAAHAFLQRGRGHAEQVLAIVERGEDVYRQVVVRGNVGEILALLGEFDAAEQLLRQTIEQARVHGYRAVEMRSRYTLGELRAAQGRHEEALAELSATLDDLRLHEHAATRMRVHRALHRSYKSLGRFEPALAHFEAYHAMEMQRLALQAHAQARLMVNRQDVEQALAGPHHAVAPVADAGRVAPHD